MEARRARLFIVPEALVTRVDISVSEAGVASASGVFFESTNPRKAWKRYYAKCRREVILCSGALSSPQLLMLR